MNNRWYQRATLREHSDGHSQATWLEILVDLIAAASLVQLASQLATDVTVARALVCLLCVAPLWIVWSGFTFFNNRFHLDDLSHRVLVLLVAVGMGAMGVSAREALSGQPGIFGIAAACAQLAVAVGYVRASVHVPVTRGFSRLWAGVFGVSAAAFAASTALPAMGTWLVWGGIVVGFVAVLLVPASRAIEQDYPLDEEHLSRRFGIFVLVLLGASFVKVQAALSVLDADLNTLARGLFHLLVTLSLWWIYFDDVAGRKLRESFGASLTWRLAHLPLTMSMMLVGVGVTLTSGAVDAGTAAAGRWLLSGSLAGAFVSVAIIDSYTERYEAALSDRLRVAIRVVSAFGLLILAQAGAGLSSTVFVVGVGVICLGQIVLDVVAVPLEEGVFEDARPLSEVDQEHRDSLGEQPHRRIDVDRTIRVGSAARSGRDLYFYLMEGSWTQAIMGFGVVYVLINALFAALFQMQTGSIVGAQDQSYWDAFFFSVQTLTSLGYGVLSPATPWANVLVTVESAVGILYGALATGFMFAKASRPRASILFSDVMVVTQRHGVNNLMLRVANARGNDVVGASMTVSVLLDEVSPEGHHFRRLHDLPLVRDVTPLFRLSWTAMHVMDESSPLHDDEVWNHVFGFIVTLTGHDGTYSQTIYDRHLYAPEDVRVGHRFVDVIRQSEDNRLVIDLDQFHKTEAEKA